MGGASATIRSGTGLAHGSLPCSSALGVRVFAPRCPLSGKSFRFRMTRDMDDDKCIKQGKDKAKSIKAQ